MVHNGIEYGEMQMICEAYHLLRSVLHLEPKEIGKIFETWNQGLLDSFLVEITADILQEKDPRTGGAFIDTVLDTAGQKGTGKWTSVNALDMGVPTPTIAEACLLVVFLLLKKNESMQPKYSITRNKLIRRLKIKTLLLKPFMTHYIVQKFVRTLKAFN